MFLKTRDDGASPKWTGEIIDYTGAELRLKPTTGKERTIPADQVVRVSTTLTETQRSGDELFAAHDFKGALAQYRAALGADKERRPWVRRQIVAQIVWCYRDLGQIEQAGQTFLQVLIAGDSGTQFFDCIPLAWTSGLPAANLERAAAGWFATADSPVAVLMGASYLLGTSQGPAALERLKRMTIDRDRRLAWLAQGQVWRATAFQASEEQLLGYLKAIDDCPEPLRAGPYFVVGNALARFRPKEAALALLRLPILYPRQRQLASAALLAAGEILRRGGQADEAAQLGQEVAGSGPSVRAGEASTDERLLDGLRARRLFDLAELYCKQRLERADLPDGERLDLVLELSRTIAAHAVESPADARGPLWKQSNDALDSFQQQHPQHPHLLALGLQKALVELAAGELARQESEVGGVQGAGFDAARTSLREAISQLKQLDEQAAAELQKRSRSARPEPGQWTAAELVSLQNTIRFQLARAYRNQALSYSPDSSDRLNALMQARELLQPLSQLLPETNLAWQSRIDDVVCHRLLRDFSVVERKLSAIAKEEPPAAVRQRLDAERIRLLLDRRDIQSALAAAGKPGQHADAEGAELSFAQLEAFVTAWRNAAAAKNATAPWEQAATDQVRFIERTHGPYWMRRAETLLAGVITAAPGSENPETLVRAAESYYRGGKLAEAVAAYDRAASQAKSAQAADQAFDLAFTAATIEHQAHHFREALDRYRALALSAPRHAKASQAHLLAAYDAAQLIQQQAADSQSKAIAEYQQLLDEHLRNWPTAATAGQAAWWLGQVNEHAGAWQTAITAYQAVPPSHAQFASAVDATARCYRGWLAELRAAGKPDERLAAEGARYFEALIISPSGHLREPWTSASRQAVLAAARLWLDDAHDGQAQAEAVLDAALSRTDDAPADWLQAARSLLVRSLAAQGRFKEAIQTANRLSGAPPEELLALVDILSRRAAAAPPADRLSLGDLQLELLALLEIDRDKLAAQQRQRLDRLRSTALADAGQRELALTIIEKLAQELPEDGQVHETWAELLTDGDAASRKQAVSKWHEVQRKSRPGSARWFRANYGLARCLLLLGKKAEARAIVRLVAKAKPDLGGAEMKPRFDKLLSECER